VKWKATTNVLKVAEGGPSRDSFRMDAERFGLRITFGHSPYVGHFAVTVQSRLKGPIKKFWKARGWDWGTPRFEEVYWFEEVD
jgi:hypothetical protein